MECREPKTENGHISSSTERTSKIQSAPNSLARGEYDQHEMNDLTIRGPSVSGKHEFFENFTKFTPRRMVHRREIGRIFFYIRIL